jgi:N-acetylmuramoyl-L-alanine amidase
LSTSWLQLPSRNLIIATTLVASLASIGSYMSRVPTLSIDGQSIPSDVPPVTTGESRAYVPLRALAESLGATATYDPRTRGIEILRGHDTVRLRVGDRVATLNGNRMTIARAPFAVRGRAMVSRELVARAFNKRVDYDAAHAQIDVVSPGRYEAGPAPSDR